MKNSFEKIIGYEAEKKELDLICDILANGQKYRDLGVYTPRGLMIHGEPGLGKTTMAKELIKSVNRKTYTIRKNDTDGSFVRRISSTFEEARKNAPSIVFLDDLDKFSDCDNHKKNNTDEFVAVQSAIDDCKDYEVFVLATANDIDCIPDSLLRTGRFDKIIRVNTPSIEDSKRIVDYYLKKKTKVCNVNSELIAKIIRGKSCSDLETVVNEAGLYAAYNDKDVIENDDIIKACLRIIFKAPENTESYTDEYKEIAAVHECGHALVSELLEPGSVNLVSINNYRGYSNGVTSCDNAEANSSLDEKKEIMISLAGKAATDVILNIKDNGTFSDLRRAESLVKSMLDDAPFSFNTFAYSFDSSQVYTNSMQATIPFILDMYYNEVKTMIFNNKDLITKLKDKLIEKSYLINDDIRKIMCA